MYEKNGIWPMKFRIPTKEICKKSQKNQSEKFSGQFVWSDTERKNIEPNKGGDWNKNGEDLLQITSLELKICVRTTQTL